MKNFLLITLFLMLSKIAGAQNVFFTNENNLFTISHPQDWRVKDESSTENIALNLDAPKGSADKRAPSFIRIATEDLESDIKTLADISRKMKQTLSAGARGVTILENKKVGDKQVFVIQMKAGDKIIKSKTAIGIKGNKMITMSYGSELKNFAKFQTINEAILKSFVML
jgi:hypothetical protein